MKRSNIILSLVLLTILNSCKKDFLEVIDKTVLLKQGYVVDLETTGHFMNGIYLDLARFYASGTDLPYPEIMADNIKQRTASFFSAAYNWNFNAEGLGSIGDPVVIWRRYYGIIRNCSFVIEKAEEFKSQNQSMSDDLTGQAMAIRAWMHFILVNIFGQQYNFSPDGAHLGIPYIKSSDIGAPISRQTVSEVYAAIINDLNAAIQLMPKANPVKEKMNYQAVKALLARISLFKEDYNAAKNLALQVLNDVPLMMSDYPGKLYTLDESEALFRVPPGPSPTVSSAILFIGYRARASSPSYVATQDIADLLKADNNDKRANWVTFSSGRWNITKFPKSVTGTFISPDGDYYQTLLRSSEMCLTAAEAYAKLNMEDSARFFIDAIRLRANPSLSNITATGTALLDSIYLERRKEMCFDGLRMWDLLRWKKGVNRLDFNNPAAQTLPYPSYKAIAAIPKVDVELSGLQQNPGY